MNELLTEQAAVLVSFDSGVDKHGVVTDGGLGVDQNSSGTLSVFFHVELVEEEIHELAVTDVPQGLVVEFLDLALVGFAHGRQTARCRERLEPQTVNEHGFELTHGRNRDSSSLFDDITLGPSVKRILVVGSMSFTAWMRLLEVLLMIKSNRA